MRVLLEITSFYLLNITIIAGLIRIRVLLEGEPYWKFYERYLQEVKAVLLNNSELYACVGIIRKPLIRIKNCLKYFWVTHKRLFEVHLVIDIALTELIKN